MTVSYVMNQVLWNDGYGRALSILLAAYDALTAWRPWFGRLSAVFWAH
jgi:hypothetical protein